MNNLICCICQNDKPALPISLACGHTFCYLCIKSLKTYNSNAKCPLCRKQIPDDIIDNMTLDDCIDTNNNTNIKYKWIYKGNNNGWWEYDNEHIAELENLYGDYLANKYLKNSSNSKYNLNIGHMIFKIDFENMEQINTDEYIRKIMRLNKNDFDKFADPIKGIAGLSKKN